MPIDKTLLRGRLVDLFSANDFSSLCRFLYVKEYHIDTDCSLENRFLNLITCIQQRQGPNGIKRLADLVDTVSYFITKLSDSEIKDIAFDLDQLDLEMVSHENSNPGYVLALFVLVAENFKVDKLVAWLVSHRPDFDFYQFKCIF